MYYYGGYQGYGNGCCGINGTGYGAAIILVLPSFAVTQFFNTNQSLLV